MKTVKSYVPQQVELWYVIPSVRKEFAKLMVKKGLSQKETAAKLGVTESAVSQYLKEKRAKETIAFDKETKTEMEKSVGRILKGGGLIREIERICKLCRKNRFICRVSKKLGYAPRGCRECFV